MTPCSLTPKKLWMRLLCLQLDSFLLTMELFYLAHCQFKAFFFLQRETLLLWLTVSKLFELAQIPELFCLQWESPCLIGVPKIWDAWLRSQESLNSWTQEFRKLQLLSKKVCQLHCLHKNSNSVEVLWSSKPSLELVEEFRNFFPCLDKAIGNSQEYQKVAQKAGIPIAGTPISERLNRGTPNRRLPGDYISDQ